MSVLAVGIAALLLISSLTTSIENTMGENVHDIITSDIILEPERRETDAMIPDVESCISVIEEHSEVKYAAPRIEVEGLISTGNGWRNTTGGVIFGIDPERDQKVSSLDEYIVKGSYNDLGSNDHSLPPVIVGSGFLKELKLHIEDGDGDIQATEKVRITLGKLREDDGNIAPIVQDFVIVAGYQTYLPYFDVLGFFIPIEQSRYLLDFNPYDPKANRILVNIEGNDASGVKEDILKRIHEKTSEELRGDTHQEYKKTYLTDIIETTRPVGYLIISISLLSAVLRMAHASASAVQERIFDIGILRAIGFTKKRVMKVYLLEATITGLGGGILGILLGYGMIAGLQRSSMKILSFPLSELSLLPSVHFMAYLLILAVGVGVLSVLGILLKVLRDPSVYLMRVQ